MKYRKLSPLRLLLLPWVIVSSSWVVAQDNVPATMTVQGKLSDSSGTPQVGSYALYFKIFDAATAGTEIWPGFAVVDSQSVATDINGLWTAAIGTDVPLTAAVFSHFSNNTRWLQIAVDTGGGIVTMPRVRLNTGPYAFRAASSQKADTALVVTGGGEGPFLPLTGGIMSGPITSVLDPAITMGKGNFGSGNVNTGTQAFVAGRNNRARGNYSVVSGGGGGAEADSNLANANGAAVGGGYRNRALDDAATVAGGARNTANGVQSVIAGGFGNFAETRAFVGGGWNNRAGANAATVGGGSTDTASGDGATVSGGNHNVASGPLTTVGGGGDNRASTDYAVVAGGEGNTASARSAAVGGGTSNTAASDWSFIGGGLLNGATSGLYATVSGGRENQASGQSATVGGGRLNVASGHNATVPGGISNDARGLISFAAGFNAKANHDGAVVIAANASGSPSDSVRSGGDDQMVLRADGGVFVSNASGLAVFDATKLINTNAGSPGAHLTTSGTWTNASSQDNKENFAPLDGSRLLDNIAALPITRWNYKVDPDSVTHIGPVAQDFYRLFGVGGDDKTISTIDPSGIALAAIQELHRQNRELKAANADLGRRLRALESFVRTNIPSHR